ncbi:hypothetical protein CLU79DRAFT_741537 [Phycomyces nitens]|nr:hypothetical protein CLU79DRAFT_741537 [Phycomyces nitens]
MVGTNMIVAFGFTGVATALSVMSDVEVLDTNTWSWTSTYSPSFDFLANDPSHSNESNNTIQHSGNTPTSFGTITGAVISSLAVFLLLLTGIYMFNRHRKRRGSSRPGHERDIPLYPKQLNDPPALDNTLVVEAHGLQTGHTYSLSVGHRPLAFDRRKGFPFDKRMSLILDQPTIPAAPARPRGHRHSSSVGASPLGIRQGALDNVTSSPQSAGGMPSPWSAPSIVPPSPFVSPGISSPWTLVRVDPTMGYLSKPDEPLQPTQVEKDGFVPAVAMKPDEITFDRQEFILESGDCSPVEPVHHPPTSRPIL